MGWIADWLGDGICLFVQIAMYNMAQACEIWWQGFIGSVKFLIAYEIHISRNMGTLPSIKFTLYTMIKIYS